MYSGVEWGIIICLCVAGAVLCFYILTKSYRNKRPEHTEYKQTRDKLTEKRKPLEGDPPEEEPEEEETEYESTGTPLLALPVIIGLIVTVFIAWPIMSAVVHDPEIQSAMNATGMGLSLSTVMNFAPVLVIMLILVFIFSLFGVFMGPPNQGDPDNEYKNTRDKLTEKRKKIK